MRIYDLNSGAYLYDIYFDVDTGVWNESMQPMDIDGTVVYEYGGIEIRLQPIVKEDNDTLFWLVVKNSSGRLVNVLGNRVCVNGQKYESIHEVTALLDGTIKYMCLRVKPEHLKEGMDIELMPQKAA